MNQFDSFTQKQKDTHGQIHQLEEQIMKLLDPSLFILNPKIGELYDQIEALQNECDHIWENNVCIICNKEKN